MSQETQMTIRTAAPDTKGHSPGSQTVLHQFLDKDSTFGYRNQESDQRSLLNPEEGTN